MKEHPNIEKPHPDVFQHIPISEEKSKEDSSGYYAIYLDTRRKI